MKTETRSCWALVTFHQKTQQMLNCCFLSSCIWFQPKLGNTCLKFSNFTLIDHKKALYSVTTVDPRRPLIVGISIPRLQRSRTRLLRIKKQKHSLRILTRRGLFSSCLLFMYHQTSCSFSWEFWSLVLTILWSLICLMGVQCIRTRIIYHLTCLGVWWTKWFTVLCSGNFSIACNIPLLCLVQRPGAGLNLSRCIDRFDVSLTCAASPLNSTSPCALKTNFFSSFLPPHTRFNRSHFSLSVHFYPVLKMTYFVIFPTVRTALLFL